MKTKIFAGILSVCLLLCLVGCAETFTKEEIKEVLPALVEKSTVLNAIYFGEGFLPSDDTEKDSNVYGYYYVKSEQYGFYSISELKDATEAVFTPEYAELLYKSAFEGLAAGETVVIPRYMEGEMGILQSMSATVYDLPERSYDFSTLQIVKSGKDRVTVTVETVTEGGREPLELIVVRYINEESGEKTYRLDSPTY